MSFSYFDNDKKLQKIDIQVGAKWSDYKVDNEQLSSIFAEVDDGDGIVQLTEKAMLDSLVKQADSQIEKTANNNILEKEELEKFDVKTGTLRQSYDKNNFTLEAVKAAYPEGRYTYSEDHGDLVITDSETGKKVARYNEIHDADRDLKFFDEFTNTGKRYQVYENQRHDESKIELNNPNKMGSDELMIGFNKGNIRSYEKGNLKLHGGTAITQQILLNHLDDPKWMKNEAVNFINNIPAEDLLEMVKTYNKNNKGGYLLEKISSSMDIPKKEKEAFIANTLKRLEEAAGYKPEGKLENSQVSNDFYQSENTYSVTYNNDIITIKQTGGKKKQKDQTIDLNKLVSDLPLDMRPLTKAAIQQMPGEALMDLAMEADRFDSPDLHKDDDSKRAGLFDPMKDRISFGYQDLSNINPGVITHELGHAIDCVNVKNGKKYTTDGNQNFIKAYNNAINKWKESGQTSDRLYLFTKPVEGFAEAYAMSMNGFSPSSTPKALTREMVDATQQQLQSIRELKAEDRHKREK